MKGLSPRVRGNRREECPEVPLYGSIPACAGEPFSLSAFQDDLPVYPRVCGGTPKSVQGSSPIQGLSPRVRGNLPGTNNALLHGRSIPACAGEPRSCR